MDVSEIYTRLQDAMRLVCEKYQGICSSIVDQLLERGLIFQAYYEITRTSPLLAKETKNALFVDLTKLMGVAKVQKTTALEHRPKGKSHVTPKWVQALINSIPWWSDPNTTIEKLCAQIDRRTILTQTLKNPSDEGALKVPAENANATAIGSYIHERYGAELADESAKIFSWHDEVSYLIPGRMIHLHMPLIGVTPDAIAVTSEDAFHNLTDDLVNGRAVDTHVRKAGIPYMTFELKTLTIKEARVSQDELNQLILTDRINGEEALKSSAFELLVKKLECGGWMPHGLVSGGDDYLKEQEEEKWTKSKNSSVFFLRKTKLYPTEQFEKFKVKRVGQCVLPNLVPYSTSGDSMTSPPPRKKRKLQGGEGHNGPSISLRDQVHPGKARLVAWDFRGNQLFSLEWEKAPLMLTLNSEHFNQVMGQHITARQYNEDVQSIFGVTLISRDADTVQPTIFYSYNVGIQATSVDGFSETLVNEVDLACQYLQSDNTSFASYIEKLTREKNWRRAGAIAQDDNPFNVDEAA